MHIFLDFDRTVFDTEAFYNALEYECMRSTFESGLFTRSLAQFLYDDVLVFLETNRNNTLHIVTYGDRSVQEAKVQATGILDHVHHVAYVESGSKATYIRSILKQSRLAVRGVFIDDTNEHLEFTTVELPEVLTIRMQRRGAKGSSIPAGKITAVTNLTEAQKIIAQL